MKIPLSKKGYFSKIAEIFSTAQNDPVCSNSKKTTYSFFKVYYNLYKSMVNAYSVHISSL